MTKEEAQEYAKTMTYSDAIYNLMKAKSIPYRKATFIKIDELLKALEQEPKQEPCEDCISRQAVLDKKELVELEDGQSFYCISPEDVETLPPVNPQEPKIDRLYSWLNDMRLGIAPDETTPQDERGDRLAQVDVIDDIMEWLDRQEG